MQSPVEIYGTRIGHGTSAAPDKLAWSDVDIYAADDGTYTVHQIGCSLIYHRQPTTCLNRGGKMRGKPATVDDLPDDAEPCPKCNPAAPDVLADRADDDDVVQVRFEYPRHTFTTCPDPASVVQQLIEVRNRDRTTEIKWSGPVIDALSQAAQNDTRFAEWKRNALGDGVPIRFGEMRHAG